MQPNATDQLIRFLLPRTCTRGAIIKAPHIRAEACRIHGLPDADAGSPGQLLGQSLIASILLLSISKGGVRQVLQLDGETGPVSRVLAESRNGAVRGYIQWRDETTSRSEKKSSLALLGRKIQCSTVRDPGFGQPYISTVQAQSDYLADVLIQYLTQSVQVRADILLHNDMGLLLEAMPGCDDTRWFEALEHMAKITSHDLEEEPADILTAFESMQPKIVGEDEYAYHCTCNSEDMAKTLAAMPAESLQGLEDETGHITLSCRYCGNTHQIKAGSGS